MNPNSDENQLARRDSQLPISKPGNLLDSAFTVLSRDQQNQLVARAGEERIKIDASEKAADLRDRTSTADMVKTVQMAKALDHSTRSDHTIRSHMETASGHTSIEIKKNNNTVIIVVAVVIGLIVLVLFSR